MRNSSGNAILHCLKKKINTEGQSFIASRILETPDVILLESNSIELVVLGPTIWNHLHSPCEIISTVCDFPYKIIEKCFQ